MVSLFLMLLLVTQDNSIIAKQVGKPNSFEAETPYGKVVIEVTSPTIYLPQDKPDAIRRFFAIGLLKGGKSVKEVGNFFATEPKPIKIGYADSPEYDIEKFKTMSLLTFKKPGETMFKVELGELIINVPISVEKVPFKKGMTSDELIATLGIPEATHKFWVKWPTDRHVDTIFYTVTAGQSIRAIEHWMFDKYPNCMFAIENEAIIGIHSVFVDEDNKSEFAERWKHPIKDAKEAAKAEASLKATVERLEKEQQQNDKPPKKEKNFETFTLKDGASVYGVFVDYKNSKAIIEKDSGEKVQFPLTNFTQKSADRIRELFKNKPKKK